MAIWICGKATLDLHVIQMIYMGYLTKQQLTVIELSGVMPCSINPVWQSFLMFHLVAWTLSQFQNFDWKSHREKLEKGRWVSTKKYSEQIAAPHSLVLLSSALLVNRGTRLVATALEWKYVQGSPAPMFPCQLQWSPLAWLFNELLFHLKQI